jgi:D-amino-acid dehydrogenase
VPGPDPRTARVVGGGVVGLGAASALQARGLAVTVADAPGDRPPASWGNAGQIATELNEPYASLARVRSLPSQLMMFGGPASFPPLAVSAWLPFGLRLLMAASPSRFEKGCHALRALMVEALPAWRRLADRAGARALLRDAGNIFAWESLAGARRGRADLRSYRSEAARSRDLTSEEARLLSGQIRRTPADAVRFEGTASLADPGQMLDALREAVVAQGGVVEARAMTLTEAKRAGADLIVVAAGVRSDALMRELGHPTPLIAERGYHIQSAETRWPESLTSVVFEERALVATRFLSGLRATSFVEFTRADAPPDPRKWARLRAMRRTSACRSTARRGRGSARAPRCRTICPPSAAARATHACSTPSATSISA